MSQHNLQLQFAAALCFMAKSALAQEGTDEEQATTEQTTEQIIEEPIAWTDKVMEAFMNPSGDHIQIYVQLGVATAIVLSVIYCAIQKPAEVKGFSLDDDPPKKRAKARVKKAPEAAQAEKRADLVDGILKKAESKSAGISEELYKELDQSGPWPLDNMGTMDSELFVKLRRIISTHQFKRFIARKEELLQERLGHYKNKNFVEYKRCIQVAGVEYQNLGVQTTQEACEYIGMNESNYVDSFKAAETKKYIMDKIREDEANTRLVAEPPRDVTFTKEQIKQMHMEKTKAEFEAEKKMATVAVSSQQEAMALAMFERTKVMDELYMKYNVKMVDLMKGFKEHNLENDEDVKTQTAAFAAEKKELINKIKKNTDMTDDQKAIVKEMIDGSGGPITEPLVNGVLSYDSLMKVISVMLRLTVRFAATLNPEYKDKRRELFNAGKDKEYGQYIGEYMRKQGLLKAQILQELLSGFGVSMDIFNRSQMMYKQNPEYAERFAKDIASFEHAEQKGVPGSDISKDEALKYIDFVEEKKAESSAQMALAVKMGKVGQQQAAMMQMFAKCKAFDQLWKEHGVEEEDITRAFYNFNLSEDPAFKEIIEQKKKYMQECIQAEARKLQQMMAQMQGRGGMPGMPGMGGMGGPGPASPGMQRNPTMNMDSPAQASAQAQVDDVANMDF